LDLVNLTPLMELTSGRPEIVIGLVDGPVVISFPGNFLANSCLKKMEIFVEAEKIADSFVEVVPPSEDDGVSRTKWTRAFSIAMDTLAQSLNGSSESRGRPADQGQMKASA
jgi:hypothetical protein